MKKLLLLLLVGVAVVLVVGYYFAPEQMPAALHPERRACQRLGSLCGSSSADDCVKAFGELREHMGDEAMRKPIKCTMEAQSCAEAAGCISGAGVNAAVKTVGDFLKGVTRSVGP